jgi:DNA-binding IscR family transcriptional regulator
LSRILHVLIHMEQQHGAPLTSEAIGRMLNTNPTVVRRTMAGLRDAGYAASEKGHGGGWTLTRPLGELTLLDVYAALGRPELFALGLSRDMPDCLVERAVNDALASTLDHAERRLLERFSEITLDTIVVGFEARTRPQPDLDRDES